jgi:hypothetical protein
MERRLILTAVKHKTALAAGATSGPGLKVVRLVPDLGSGPGLTDVLREMAVQVRLLSATVDSLNRQAG